MGKTKQEINKTVKSYLRELAKRNINVERVILFGSYANGNPREDSDIDLAIISSSWNNKSLYNRLITLGRAMWGMGMPMEVLGYTPEEYKNAKPTSFIGEIKRTGKIIYKKSRAHS